MTEDARVKVLIVKGRRKGAVYVGRPSIFGNPHRLAKVGSNEEAVRLYALWFGQRLRDPDFLEALERLYRKLKREKELVLSCYCAPKACHAEVIAYWLVNRGTEEGLRVEVKVEGRG